MKFKVSSGTLGAKLQPLAKIISQKAALPILNYFLFELKGNKLYVTASDGENTALTYMDVEADGDGKFCLQAADIVDMLRELPEQPIALDVDPEARQLEVTYQSGEYHLVTEDAGIYPQGKHFKTDPIVTVISSEQLSSAIGRSLFAVSTDDELHPAMSGICFDYFTDHLSVVACDGHKLVLSKIGESTSQTQAKFILPRRPANVLKGLVDKISGDVSIKFTQDYAEFHYEGGMLGSVLIEGAFPKYEEVVKQSNPNELIVDRKTLLGAIRRALPFASASSQLVRLKVESGKLEITSEDIDFAKSSKESVMCEYTGMPMSIGFRGTGLQDVLSNLEGEQVRVELGDAARPGLFRPVEKNDKVDVLMMLMPMMLTEI